MVLCRHCRQNVMPKIYSTWNGFIYGLGIFYLIYILTEVPHCPNCNFPMPRRCMVFAIQPLQNLIKLERMSVLQLANLKDRAISAVISASRKSHINRKFDTSKHFASKKHIPNHILQYDGVWTQNYIEATEQTAENDNHA